jgi:hypothetical protein
MTHDIAFLHTSPVHVPTFDRLMQELAPTLHVAHSVREDLLADAQQEGVDSPGLIGRVHAALAEAASTGAAVVVCTCSTLGGIAEDSDGLAACRVTRIDRAMADLAARSGPQVLLVAALHSTLGPTAALLQTSARRLGAGLDIDSLVVADAWAHFQAGDHTRYIDTVATAVANAAPAGTVVLAQASMAPAAERLAVRGISALTSPRLGVEHAIGLLSQPIHSP